MPQNESKSYNVAGTKFTITPHVVDGMEWVEVSINMLTEWTNEFFEFIKNELRTNDKSYKILTHSPNEAQQNRKDVLWLNLPKYDPSFWGETIKWVQNLWRKTCGITNTQIMVAHLYNIIRDLEVQYGGKDPIGSRYVKTEVDDSGISLEQNPTVLKIMDILTNNMETVRLRGNTKTENLAVRVAQYFLQRDIIEDNELLKALHERIKSRFMDDGQRIKIDIEPKHVMAEMELLAEGLLQEFKIWQSRGLQSGDFVNRVKPKAQNELNAIGLKLR